MEWLMGKMGVPILHCRSWPGPAFCYSAMATSKLWVAGARTPELVTRSCICGEGFWRGHGTLLHFVFLVGGPALYKCFHIGSARFADSIPMLESTGRHAHASLEFIRARARQHQQEEEEDEPYEETPSKRQCSAYLRSSDLPRDIFQHPPAFPVSPLQAAIPNWHFRWEARAITVQVIWAAF